MPLAEITAAITAFTQSGQTDISPDTRLDSLGIDSLKAINIVYELEEKFDIEVPNETIAQLVTVNDIDVAITKLLTERSR